MKKTILSLLLVCSTILAEVTNLEVSPKLIEENKIKIIDIRTQSEWEEMGIISGAYLLTFFTKDNEFHSQSFLNALNMIVAKDEQFAIVSNTSSRTKLVSNFLGHKHNYNVINLIGGMSKLLKDGYQVEKYNPTYEVEESKKEDNNSTIK